MVNKQEKNIIYLNHHLFYVKLIPDYLKCYHAGKLSNCIEFRYVGISNFLIIRPLNYFACKKAKPLKFGNHEKTGISYSDHNHDHDQ